MKLRFLTFGLICWAAVTTAFAASSSVIKLDPSIVTNGFTGIPVITPDNIKTRMLEAKARDQAIKHFCEATAMYFKKYGWENDPCGTVQWKAELTSPNGHPLIYATFGEGEERTLVLSGVHPDELTPVPIAFRFAKFLAANPDQFAKQGIKIIVAPLVNPDGFLRNVASRTNVNGVDVNRNFFTLDWYEGAKQLWISRRERNPRHFPGYFPNSEVETLFQITLVDRYMPDKILSIHAPLGFLDYDGPGDRKPEALSPTEERARRLVTSISEKSKNYKVVDYSFYPGSLGNYAGNERNIPTVTLELETTKPEKVDEYWKQFLPGMIQSIHYPFISDAPKATGNATKFSQDYAMDIGED